MPQATHASTPQHLSIQQAAAHVVALINSSPRSPRQDEIEAIIARAVAPDIPDWIRNTKLAGLWREGDTLVPLSPPSPDHLEYRELIAEIEQYNEPGFASDDEGDAALARLQDQVMELERKIWATPATTLADVFLRGEIALYNENGILDNLDDPDACYDERANAQLIEAVVRVGRLHASR